MKDYHKSALTETGLILLFTVLPTLFSIFKIFFSADNLENDILYKSGEFFLYAVSLLGSAYLIFNNYKLKKGDSNSVFSGICIILILAFSLTYTAVANIKSTNVGRVKNYSLLALTVSVLIFYRSAVISNKKPPDVAEQRREEQQTIEDGLN